MYCLLCSILYIVAAEKKSCIQNRFSHRATVFPISVALGLYTEAATAGAEE